MQNSRGGADGDGGSQAGRGGFRVGGQVGGHGSFGTLHFFLNCSRNGVEKGKSDTEQYMKCLRRLLESMGFHVVVDNFFRNCHCENGDWHCTKGVCGRGMKQRKKVIWKMQRRYGGNPRLVT